MDKKLLTIAVMSVMLAANGATVLAAETNTTTTLNTTVSTELPDGTLIKIPGDSKVYVIQNGEKNWIRTPEEFKNGGYDWKKIRTISPDRFSKIKEKVQELADLVSDKDGKIYRIINGKRVWIPDEDALKAQGCRKQDARRDDNRIKQCPEVRLVKDSRGNIYYITEKGKKRLVPTKDVYRCYGVKPENVIRIPDQIIYSLKNDNSKKNTCSSNDRHDGRQHTEDSQNHHRR